MRGKRILKIVVLVGIPAGALFGAQAYVDRELPSHVKFVDLDGIREIRKAGKLIGLDVEQLPEPPGGQRELTELPRLPTLPKVSTMPPTPPPRQPETSEEPPPPIGEPEERRMPSLDELRLPYETHRHRIRELRQPASSSR